MAHFRYQRTIHFADTDAAGVVFFARYLSMAHEAYEEALAHTGIPLAEFFRDHVIVVPIAKSEAAYLRPLHSGEQVVIDVTPTRLTPHRFAVDYVIWKVGPPEKRAAVIRTEHVCIDSESRQKSDLPAALAHWVDASAPS